MRNNIKNNSFVFHSSKFTWTDTHFDSQRHITRIDHKSVFQSFSMGTGGELPSFYYTFRLKWLKLWMTKKMMLIANYYCANIVLNYAVTHSFLIFLINALTPFSSVRIALLQSLTPHTLNRNILHPLIISGYWCLLILSPSPALGNSFVSYSMSSNSSIQIPPPSQFCLPPRRLL